MSRRWMHRASQDLICLCHMSDCCQDEYFKLDSKRSSGRLWQSWTKKENVKYQRQENQKRKTLKEISKKIIIKIYLIFHFPKEIKKHSISK